MLARKLPALTVEIDGAQITLSKRLGSQVAKLASEAAIKSLKAAHAWADPDDQLDQLNKIHELLDLIDRLHPQIKHHADMLSHAADVLDGGDLTETGALVELSATTFALLKTLREAVPDMDTADTEFARATLREAADVLYADAKMMVQRRPRIDDACKAATGIVLTRKNAFTHLVDRKYEAPDHWILPNGTEEDVQKAAAACRAKDLDADKRRKSDRRSAERKKLSDQMKEVWNV